MPSEGPDAFKNGRESDSTRAARRYKALTLERGNGYRVHLVFLAMPGTHHRGLFIEKEGVALAKGVIASHVRGLGLADVEMAMPPPPDSNALLVVRLTGPDDEKTLDQIAETVRSFVRSQGFDVP